MRSRSSSVVVISETASNVSTPQTSVDLCCGGGCEGKERRSGSYCTVNDAAIPPVPLPLPPPPNLQEMFYIPDSADEMELDLIPDSENEGEVLVAARPLPVRTVRTATSTLRRDGDIIISDSEDGEVLGMESDVIKDTAEEKKMIGDQMVNHHASISRPVLSSTPPRTTAVHQASRRLLSGSRKDRVAQRKEFNKRRPRRRLLTQSDDSEADEGVCSHQLYQAAPLTKEEKGKGRPVIQDEEDEDDEGNSSTRSTSPSDSDSDLSHSVSSPVASSSQLLPPDSSNRKRKKRSRTSLAKKKPRLETVTNVPLCLPPSIYEGALRANRHAPFVDIFRDLHGQRNLDVIAKVERERQQHEGDVAIGKRLLADYLAEKEPKSIEVIKVVRRDGSKVRSLRHGGSQVYSVGDHVRVAAKGVFKMAVEDERVEVCYARITSISRHRSPRIGLHWYWRMPQTFIGETQSEGSREIFTSDLVSPDESPDGLLGKIQVTRVRLGEKPKEEWKGYYCSKFYDETTRTFVRTTPALESPPPDIEYAYLNPKAGELEADDPELDESSFTYDGLVYHLYDLVYVPIQAENGGTYRLGRIDQLIVAEAARDRVVKIKVRWFIRVSSIIPPRQLSSLLTTTTLSGQDTPMQDDNFNSERDLFLTDQCSVIDPNLLYMKFSLLIHPDDISDLNAGRANPFADPDTFICQFMLKDAGRWMNVKESATREVGTVKRKRTRELSALDAEDVVTSLEPAWARLSHHECRICAAEVQSNRERRLLVEAVPLRAVEVCAGIGNLSLGIEAETNFRVVQMIEINPNAAKVLKLNYPKKEIICDDFIEWLRQGKKLDACELFCAGFPCQSFSTANRNRSTERNSLLYLSVLHFIEVYRPQIIVLENVMDIINAKLLAACEDEEERGALQAFLVRSLLDLGYQVRVGILNAPCFGAAQTRNRWFCFAALEGVELPAFPEPTHTGSTMRCSIDSLNPTFNASSTKRPKTCLRQDGGAPHAQVTVAETIGDLLPFEYSTVTADPVRALFNPRPLNPHNGRDFFGTLGYDYPVPYAAPASTSVQQYLRQGSTSVAQHRTHGTDHRETVQMYTQIGTRAEGGFGDYRDADDSQLRRRYAAQHAKLIQEYNEKKIKQLTPELSDGGFEPDGGDAAAEAEEEEEKLSYPVLNELPPSGISKLPFVRVLPNGISPTLICVIHPRGTGPHRCRLHPDQCRLLSVQELARLQGILDSFDFGDASVSSIIRMIGNAVHCFVSNAIGREIRKVMTRRGMLGGFYDSQKRLLRNDRLKAKRSRPVFGGIVFKAVN